MYWLAKVCVMSCQKLDPSFNVFLIPFTTPPLQTLFLEVIIWHYVLCIKIHKIQQLCIEFRKHLTNLTVRRVLIKNLEMLNKSMWKSGSLAVLVWTWFFIIRECWCLEHLNVLLKVTPGKWWGPAKQLKNIFNFCMLFSDMITQGYNMFFRCY